MGTNQKHTPGPWRVNAPASVVSIDGLHVCDVNGYGATDERKQADASLISAAPDLLAALEELLADKYLSDPINADRMANARAAILKAKGEA